MHARVDKIKALPNYMLLATFVDGVKKTYDVKPLMNDRDAFRPLKEVKGLFDTVRVDCSGYGIVWNDEIDLDSQELWVNGQEVKQ